MKPTIQELFDEYFLYLGKASVSRTSVEHIELIESLEKKFGKPFMHFNTAELQEYILSIKMHKAAKDSGGLRSIAHYAAIASFYRGMWNWYAVKYEVIVNPWNEKVMRGNKVKEWFFVEEKKIPYDLNERVFNFIAEEYGNNKDKNLSIYLECIMRMFYEGFQRNKDIVLLRSEDIDRENKTIKIERRTIHVSDRLLKLMDMVRMMDAVDSDKKIRPMKHYRDSYLKFPSYASQEDLDARTPEQFANIMCQSFNNRIRQPMGLAFDSKDLYHIGFLHFCVSRLGMEKVYEILDSSRDVAANTILEDLGNEYGYKMPKSLHYVKDVMAKYL